MARNKKLHIDVIMNADAYSDKDPDYRGLTRGTSDNMEFYVSQALRKKHEVRIIPFHDRPEPLMDAFARTRPDLVFNMVQYFQNDRRGEILIPAMLDLLNIRYTGPSSYGIMLTNDKKLCKDVLRQHGLPVPECTELPLNGRANSDGLRFPSIIKPNFGGTSDCINANNIIHSADRLKKLLQKIGRAGYASAVAESFIAGREITVALVGNGKNLHVYGPREVVFGTSSGNGIMTERIKSGRKLGRQFRVFSQPLKKPAACVTEVKDLAAHAFTALKLRDYARLDMRMDAEGKLYIIDVNCNCNLRPSTRSFLKQFGNEAFEKTIGKIVNAAMVRK